MNQSDSRTTAAPAPQPGAPLPSPAEVSATRERSQSLASVSRNPESFGSTGADAEPDSAGKGSERTRAGPLLPVHPAVLSCFLSETFAPRFSWPVCSVNLWTVYWPRSRGATAGCGLCAPPRAAANAAACGLLCTPGPTPAARASPWAPTAACATSAGRPQSAWTSPWRFPKCFTTNEQ